MRWESTSVTDRGLIRPNNEDAALECADPGLFAVADGMGGHAAGEIASRIAVEALQAEAGSGDAADNPADLLVRAFAAANSEIRRRGRADPETRGMGTTLTVLRFIPDSERGLIAHVGDSRAYRMRAGRMEQLTKDHTWVQERVDAGVLTPEQARAHPYASILTRVLGTDDTIDPDIVAVDTEPGDVFLLCSDGLSGMVLDADLERILEASDGLPGMASRLVEAAMQNGGFDNVTLVLVRILSE